MSVDVDFFWGAYANFCFESVGCVNFQGVFWYEYIIVFRCFCLFLNMFSLHFCCCLFFWLLFLFFVAILLLVVIVVRFLRGWAGMANVTCNSLLFFLASLIA